MVFSLITTTYRLEEGADGTSNNTNHPSCTWRVKMKGEESIKGERGTERMESKEKRETL